MKNLNLLALFAFLFLFISCSDDDEAAEPEADSLVGLYQLVSATLQTDIIGIGDSLLIPAGTDITEGISAALLADAPCSDDANTRVELLDGGTLNYTCLNEDTTEPNGVWSINDDRTILNLTINIPDSPTPVPLNLTDLVESSTRIEGTVTDLPLPNSVFGLVIEETGALALSVTVDLQFDKEQ